MRRGWTRWSVILLTILPVTAGRGDDANPSATANLHRRLQPFVQSPLSEEHGASGLMEAYDAILSTLRRCRTSADLEVRVRARDVLERMVLAIRIRRVEALLPEELVGKFAEFRRIHPQMTEDIFSRDPIRQVQVLKQLEEQKDPQGLAEPLLVICMKHPSRELRAWAAAAGVKKQYRSDVFVDALCAIIEHDFSVNPSEFYIVFGEDVNSNAPPSVLESALDTLRLTRPARAGGKLLKLLDRQRDYEMNNRLYLAEAIGLLRAPALIPQLLERLPRRPKPYYSRTMEDGREIAFAPGDDALLALLRLTDQSPRQYNLIVEPGRTMYDAVLGFIDDSERRKAYKKMKAWWEANQNRPQYAITAAASQPATAPTSAPATSRPAATQPVPRPRDAARLKRCVTAEVRRLCRELSDENYRHRQAACDQLVRLQDKILEVVLTGVRSAPPEERQARLRLVEEMMMSARVEEFLYDQPSEMVASLETLRGERPQAYQDFFSLSSHKRAEALKTLTQDDTAARAESFVVSALKISTTRWCPRRLRFLILAGIVRSRFESCSQVRSANDICSSSRGSGVIMVRTRILRICLGSRRWGRWAETIA